MRKKKISTKYILGEVANIYLECQHFVNLGRANTTLYEQSNEFILDLENVVKTFTPNMSDAEKADMYVRHGLYPTKDYFKKP